MRLLITGGAGFIGSNLTKAALNSDHQVNLLDDFSTGARENIEGLAVSLFEGSLLDPKVIAAALKGVDAVIHLAALGSVPRSIFDPLGTHAANATGTLILLEEARRAKVRRVVAASSSSVYGMNPELPKSERNWVRPMSPYAVSKLATEQYVLAYQQAFGFQTLSFRFFNVYGPGQRSNHDYAAVIPIFMDAILSGRPLPIFGDGLQSRDFTYVGTVCRVLLDSVERRISHPEPINLAFGTKTSLVELVGHIEYVTGRSARIEYEEGRPGDVRQSQADNRNLCSFFPAIQAVSLRDGLRETLNWFESIR